MIKEWIKLGEALLDEKKLLKEFLFLPSGKRTPLFSAFFRQLTSVKNYDELMKLVTKRKYVKNKKRCSICEKEIAARPLSKYIFPFVIDAQKFPNLYPSASPKNKFYICEYCCNKLLSAYAGIFWYADWANGRFLGLLLYSDNKDLLKTFLKPILCDRTIIESGNISNISFLNKLRGVDKISFRFSYPYEFTFKILYEIVKKLQLLEADKNIEEFFDTLKLFIFRIENAFKTKSVTTELNALFIGSEFLKFMLEIINIDEKKEEKGKLSFSQQLYLYTRKYETSGEKNPQADLIYREKFFKCVIKKTKIPPELLEELLVYNLSKSESKNKPKGYKNIFARIIFRFLKLYYNYISMEEREMLEIAEKEGWRMGTELKKIEDSTKKVVAYIYELRRCRSPTDFMECLNSLQLRAGYKFSKDFMELTKEKRDNFKSWKTYFLIGMANSIVGREEEGENEK